MLINGTDNYTEFCLVMLSMYGMFAVVGILIGIYHLSSEEK